MEKIMLFVDIDGVINVRSLGNSEFIGRYQGFDLYGSPVPMARRFLQIVDQADWIKPLWISWGWRKHAVLWNHWSKTRPWQTGYPISYREIKDVITNYPKMSLDEIEDGKTLAAIWHSKKANKIVWIEDGFPSSAIAWAKADNRVTLIDTLHPSDMTQSGIQTWNIDKIEAALNLNLNQA